MEKEVLCTVENHLTDSYRPFLLINHVFKTKGFVNEDQKIHLEGHDLDKCNPTQLTAAGK